MFRARLASLALLAGLGLVSGCSGDFSLHNLFHRGACDTCCPPDCPTCYGGGGLEGLEGPVLPPQNGTVIVPGPTTVPPVAGTPRLSPAPATPYPYTPSGLIR
jgi:hypothetical protein